MPMEAIRPRKVERNVVGDVVAAISSSQIQTPPLLCSNSSAARAKAFWWLRLHPITAHPLTREAWMDCFWVFPTRKDTTHRLSEEASVHENRQIFEPCHFMIPLWHCSCWPSTAGSTSTFENPYSFSKAMALRRRSCRLVKLISSTGHRNTFGTICLQEPMTKPSTFVYGTSALEWEKQACSYLPL